MATSSLEKALGTYFRDPALLQHALVHPSLVNEQGGVPQDSYERMEFLGDAVLELAISAQLYGHFPDLPEGELTKLRSALVRGETLAAVARRIDLGSFLLLGKGEDATGGRDKDSNLAAAFEALVAAVYLDRGYQEARQFVLRMMAPELADSLRQQSLVESPKSQLQEYLQGAGRPSPTYREVSREGPDHDPVFTVEVVVEGEVLARGQGGKKADAEREAAQRALERLLGSA